MSHSPRRCVGAGARAASVCARACCAPAAPPVGAPEGAKVPCEGTAASPDGASACEEGAEEPPSAAGDLSGEAEGEAGAVPSAPVPPLPTFLPRCRASQRRPSRRPKASRLQVVRSMMASHSIAPRATAGSRSKHGRPRGTARSSRTTRQRWTTNCTMPGNRSHSSRTQRRVPCSNSRSSQVAAESLGERKVHPHTSRSSGGFSGSGVGSSNQRSKPPNSSRTASLLSSSLASSEMASTVSAFAENLATPWWMRQPQRSAKPRPWTMREACSMCFVTASGAHCNSWPQAKVTRS
mmetsp:Transcript_18470/g.51365  ORF Transcript_18470/g.51365 Transcript_18470/m.51365 type:complete len:294 (+) Transcript_18470:102-983(+)